MRINSINFFLSFEFSDEKLIGVHCTHGINRTGYLICAYMIKHLKIDPNDAINRFNEGRGHNLERINYINALKNLNRTRSISSHKSRERSRSPQKRAYSTHRKDYNDRNDWRSPNHYENGNQRNGPVHRQNNEYQNRNNRGFNSGYDQNSSYHRNSYNHGGRQSDPYCRIESGYNSRNQVGRYEPTSWRGIRGPDYNNQPPLSATRHPPYGNHDGKPAPYSWSLKRT